MENDPLAQALARLKAEGSNAAGGVDHVSRADALIAKLEADEKAAAEAARKPAQMPAAARPGDSGLLPEPEPFSWGGAARAVGQQFVNEAKAIPAAFNDAFSMGAIPRIQEAQGGSLPPGSYRQAMDAGPVGTAIGHAAGIALSGGVGLAKPFAQGGQMLASGLRRAGAFASPVTERAVASGVAAGGYGAADAAVRGGTPEQVFDAGMTAGMIGAAIPVAAKGASVAAEKASKLADKSVAAAEEHGMGRVIDQATGGKVDKAATQLEKGVAVDAALDSESAGKEAILAAARKHGLGKELVGQSVPKFAKAIETRREAAGKKVGEYVEKAQQLTPGVRLDAVVDSLENAKSQHSLVSPEYDAINQKIAAFKQAYGGTNVVAGVPRIPLWEVQDAAGKLADQGYAGVGQAFNDPTASKRLGRQMAKALREPLYDEINRVALRNPSSVGTPEGFAKARADFSELSALADIAEAARPKSTTGKVGLFGRMDAWEHIKRAAEGSALAGVSHLAGLPHEMTAGLAMLPYVKPTAQAANVGIAKLINAARAGWPAHLYGTAAESLGVSPEIAGRIWQQFGPATIGATGAQEAEPQGGP